MEEIVKHINDTNASYRSIGAGDAKNTDLFLDNEHYSYFDGCGDEITVRFNKENLSQAILFIASVLPKKFDQSATHKVIKYSQDFILNQLALIEALFKVGGHEVKTFTQTWTVRKDVPKKNGEIDTRFYFKGLLKEIQYMNARGEVINDKFTIRNYLVGGYSEVHIKKADDGIFDVNIKNVTTPYQDDKEHGTEIIELPRSSNLQQIYFGAPGTGKSHEINKACKAYENYRTTFHPDTDYAGFVGAYKPINTKVPIYDASGHPILEKDENGKEKPVLQPRIEYRYVFQAFLKAYIAAWKEQQNDEPKPVFLVIEEINRGNCAQIFGDIFQLLDRNASGYSDYPIVADDDLAKELKEVFKDLNIVKHQEINDLYKDGKDVMKSVLNGEQLLLPNNLYIWATMNTSDQSLFPIDSAFKRRWDWKYIKIKDHGDQAYKIKFKNGKEYDWWEFIEAINSKIEGGEIQQEDKKLGYFFAKAKEDADGNKLISAETFLSKVIFYLYNDVFKDFGFDEAFFKDENGQVMTFASYFDDEGRPNEARVERFVRNVTNADEKEKIAAEETSTDQSEQEEADTVADENPD